MQPFEQLEVAWSQFNDLDPAGMVACSSGTAALHLALESLRLPACSEVVVPDFTMIACARAVALAGLTPVFVDCDQRGLIDNRLMQDEVLAKRPKAVMLVHVYGRQCAEIAAGVPVIEDLAEAHGVRPHGSTDAAAWSFYSNKIVCGQEGGAVWFRDPEHAKLARQLRSLGFTDRHDFWHLPRGANYRMSNVHAELVLKSLAQYPDNLKRRWDAWHWYNDLCPWEWRLNKPDAPWVFDLRIPNLTPTQQYAAVDALNAVGIAARHPFRPCHRQQEFVGCRFVHAPDREPWSVALSRSRLYLPLTPGAVTPTSAAEAFRILKEVTDAKPAPDLP